MLPGMGTRIGLGLLLAATGLVSLQFCLGANESMARERSDTVAPSGSRPMALRKLRGTAKLIYLVRNASDLPEAVAPAFEVVGQAPPLSLRPPPLAVGPQAEIWPAAGVVLGVESLEDLTPRQRVGLLDILATLSGGRAWEPSQLVGHGVRCPRSVVEQLLRWQR